MDAAARVTSKGQITIPKAVRDALGIEAGDEVAFRVEGQRAVLARTPHFLELAGTIRVPAARGNAAWDDVVRGDSPFASGGEALTAFVDTNVLVRHLTGDPPDMARRATAFLGETSDLLLSDLIVAETVYVLESYYEAPRDQIAVSIRSLVAFESILTVSADVILRAVEIYEVDRLDFAEAYLVACAESTGVNAVASFDTAIDRIDTVRRIAP